MDRMLGQHITCGRKTLCRVKGREGSYTVSQKANNNIDNMNQNIISAYSRPSQSGRHIYQPHVKMYYSLSI